MGFGGWQRIREIPIRGTIVWIRSRGMACINGKMDGCIKEISIMTSEMDLGNCMKGKNSFIGGFGGTGSRLRNK